MVDMVEEFDKIEASLLSKVYLDEEDRISYRQLEKEKQVQALEIKPCVLDLAKTFHPLVLPYTKFDLSNLLERFIVKETVELSKKGLVKLEGLKAFSKEEKNNLLKETQEQES